MKTIHYSFGAVVILLMITIIYLFWLQREQVSLVRTNMEQKAMLEKCNSTRCMECPPQGNHRTLQFDADGIDSIRNWEAILSTARLTYQDAGNNEVAFDLR